jgi:mannose-6-phosphate isomerase-like protein (cupin superfamily)
MLVSRWLFVAAALILCTPALAQEAQLETPRLREAQQRALPEFGPAATAFKFSFAAVTGGSKVENAAALQLQVDKLSKSFLSTLPYPGAAQFLTAIKPCGILTPHVHQRATELYSVLYGTMGAGIAQENGAAQNIVFDVLPGEVFVVPQGLVHFNANNQCSPLVFLQSFNNADPGAISLGNALAALGNSTNGASAIAASNIQATPTGLAAFGLDASCLQRCGLPATGGALDDLPAEFQALFGLAGGATGGATPATPRPLPLGPSDAPAVLAPTAGFSGRKLA